MAEETPNIDPSKSALLVMDYQAGIISRLPDPDAQVARAAEVIDLLRRRQGTVGYVRVAFADADYEAIPATSMMGNRVAQGGKAMHADSPATAIDERLAPRDGDIVVRKSRVGAFSTTDLAEQLRERGIDTLVLAGISTSGVVLSTVRDASDRDYRIYVLKDASADPDAEVHRFLTEKIFPRQAYVVDTKQLNDLLS